jgi:hypothetical protein
LDFKSRMYRYGKEEVKQFEFAKDVIAFANVARRTAECVKGFWTRMAKV